MSTPIEYFDRWNIQRRGRNFHPSKERQNDAPNTMVALDHPRSNIPRREIYENIKKLGSFISRNNLTSVNVRKLAYLVLQEFCKIHGFTIGAIPKQKRDFAVIELNKLSETSDNVYGSFDPDRYSYLYQFLNIFIHDLETRNPRHKCTRIECKEFCILPLYANRCMSDSTIDEIFEGIKRIVALHPEFILTTESETAQNLLDHLAFQGNPVLKQCYAVLYAMAGEQETIFNPDAYVDSRLYELIFDLFRQYGVHGSVPWLNEGESRELREVISAIEDGGVEGLQRYWSTESCRPGAADAGREKAGAPGGRDRNPPRGESAGMGGSTWAADTTAQMGGSSIGGSTLAQSGSVNAPPPSYKSVMGVGENQPPTHPTAPPIPPSVEDMELPSYEEAVVMCLQKLERNTAV